jgi:hypothetical protein
VSCLCRTGRFREAVNPPDSIFWSDRVVSSCFFASFLAMCELSRDGGILSKSARSAWWAAQGKTVVLSG